MENSVHPESYGADAFGVYGTFDVSSAANLDLFAIHNRDNAADKTAQTTLGTRLFGAASGFTYRGEFNLQTGERAGSDVSAYLFGARVGKTFNEGRTQFTLWYDYLSGDADPTDDEVEVFDTLFATNHKFYGFADLFLNIPVHTGGLGLQDMAVKATHRLSETVNIGADFHRFTSAQEAADGSLLGHEVDVSLGYRFAPSLRVSAGFSQVWAEDNLINLGRAGGDVSYGYIMMDALF